MVKAFVALYIASAALLFSHVYSHGAMIWPPQRGTTNGFKFAQTKVKISGDQSDWYPHFPAGDKSTAPGAAIRSQKQAAGPAGWVPYDPFNPNFRWRAGVCGDTTWGKDHMRGGKFYNGGKVHASYKQGGQISVDLAIIAHHNGYMELYVCDVAKCGGEISRQCFQQRSCYKLNRSWDNSCESRTDPLCAPIDQKHPSRFYLPCGKSYSPGRGTDVFGGGKIKYNLPKDLHCEHCVLQWYWVSANTCNPPGLLEYYKSDRAPQWGECPGQGEAKGGYRRWDTPCGGGNLSEEYYTCADIRIDKAGGTWGTASNNHVGARGRKREPSSGGNRTPSRSAPKRPNTPTSTGSKPKKRKRRRRRRKRSGKKKGKKKGGKRRRRKKKKTTQQPTNTWGQPTNTWRQPTNTWGRPTQRRSVAVEEVQPILRPPRRW